MRRVLFWLILLIALFLVIVLGVAATRKVSPKSVLQDRFGQTNSSMTGENLDNPSGNGNEETPSDIMTGDATTTGLSDQDKQETQIFLDSLIQVQ